MLYLPQAVVGNGRGGSTACSAVFVRLAYEYLYEQERLNVERLEMLVLNETWRDLGRIS